MSDFSDYNRPKASGANPGPNLSEEAKKLGRDLKDTASKVGDSVAGLVKEQASDLGAAAKELASGATDKMNAAVNDQKAAGADYVSNIAQVVHRAAGEFEKEIPQAAQYIHSAANQIDTVAKAVRDREIGQLYNEVRDFARRQPTAFFGGAVILGFAAIRFFKSAQTAGQTIASSEPAGKTAQAAGNQIPRHSAHLM